jgi:hypothetical protein
MNGSVIGVPICEQISPLFPFVKSPVSFVPSIVLIAHENAVHIGNSGSLCLRAIDALRIYARRTYIHANFQFAKHH